MDFMATLEKNNITPNRVTFQLCVALYCQAGDIAQATTILQHMKKNDMAINESVLLSLLSAHCASNDSDAVYSILSTIANADISLGVDVFTTMAVSYARSGNWEKVQETLEKANSENILFDDSNIFAIMKGCVDGNLVKESFSLIEKLPRKRGFFQELRNAIPHLSQAGNIPLLMELVFKQEDRAGFDKSNQGAYLVSSITKSGASVEEIVAAILRLEEDGYSLAIQQMLQEASYCWPTEQCAVLTEQLSQALGERRPAMHVGKANSFLREMFESERDSDKILTCLKNFSVCGVPIPQDFVALNLLPAMLDMNLTRPRDVIHQIKQSCTKLAFSSLGNSVINHLLNQRTAEGFALATEFFLYNNIVYSKANTWNAALSRAYLCTKDVENLTTVIFLGQREKLLWDNDPLVSLNYLFKTFSYIQKQASIIQPRVSSDEALAPIIEDLIKHKIGFPKNVDCYNKIYENIKSPELKDLLVKATNVWEEGKSFWTEEEQSSFIQSRKNLLRDKLPERSADGQKDKRDPESVTFLQRSADRLQADGKHDFKVLDKLILKYVEMEDFDKAKEILNNPRSSGKSFVLSPGTLDKFVTGLVKAKKSDEASRLLLEEMELDKEKRISGETLKICLVGLAESDNHSGVMGLLQSVDKSRLYNRYHSTNKLLEVYSKKGEDEKLHEVFEYLISNDLASANDNLNALIDIHLERNDLPAATQEFLRIASVHKKLPRKFQLTCKLIEDEDVEAIQQITDISTKISSGSKAIYDLAHCFLSMNQKSKARQLFESPGLTYEQDRTEYIYHKLEESNPKACADFVAVTKNVFGCDRDLLYRKLVGTQKNDPDKVEDVWLLIQEEGHVPSDGLKKMIAEVLSSHDRNIPFERPQEVSQDVEHPVLSDNDVYLALRKGMTKDALKLTMDSFEEEHRKTSLKCKRAVLDHLINRNDFNGASELASKIANNFGDTSKINFLQQFYEIRRRLGDKKGEKFFKSLPPDLATHLRKNYRGDGEGDDKATLSSRRELLNELLQNGELEEASKHVIEICANDDKKQLGSIIKQATALIEKLGKLSKIEEMEHLFTNLGSECSKILRTDYRYKRALIRNKPEKYFEVLKEREDMKYIISTEMLKGVIDQNATFLSQLEELAASGNVVATVMMTRLSLDKLDKEMFLKYYRSCPQNVNGSLIFEKIDTEEKFSLCLSETEKNRNHLSAVTNRHLYHLVKDQDQDNFVRIANIGVEKGLDVSDFAYSYMTKLAARDDFKLQKEAAARLSSEK